MDAFLKAAPKDAGLKLEECERKAATRRRKDHRPPTLTCQRHLARTEPSQLCDRRARSHGPSRRRNHRHRRPDRRSHGSRRRLGGPAAPARTASDASREQDGRDSAPDHTLTRSTHAHSSASVLRVDGQAREQAIRDSKQPRGEPTITRPRGRADGGRGGKRQLRLVRTPIGGNSRMQLRIRDAPALPERAVASDRPCHEPDEHLPRRNDQRPFVLSESLRQTVRRGPELDDWVRAVSIPASLLRPRPARGKVHAQACDPDHAASRRRGPNRSDNQGACRSCTQASSTGTARDGCKPTSPIWHSNTPDRPAHTNDTEQPPF